jgi:tripartite-type tricarboxylate transporter receptor subunit TctC
MPTTIPGIVLGLAMIPSALGQSFPERPIQLIHPFSVGSGSDVGARTMSAEAAKVLGQPIVVENRTGANGRAGIQAMNGAKADGHVLALISDGIVVTQPLLDPAFKLEVDKTFLPLTFLFESPLTLATNPSLPFRDLKGLVSYAKQNPGKLTFAVTQGTSSQFFAYLFQYTAGIDLRQIPYKAVNLALPDLLEGRVDLFMSSTVIKSNIDSGKLIGLATTGNVRWAPFANLPTFAEAGVPISLSLWYGIILPVGTPRDVVTKLSNAFNQSLRVTAVQKRLDELGMVYYPENTPSDLAARIRSDIKVWEPVIRKAGVKLD